MPGFQSHSVLAESLNDEVRAFGHRGKRKRGKKRNTNIRQCPLSVKSLNTVLSTKTHTNTHKHLDVCIFIHTFIF